MDHLKSLNAQHVGVFENLSIIFSPDTNILIGGNSSGKTTILKLITYCFSIDNINMRFRKGASYSVEANLNGENFTIGVDNLVDQDQQYRQFNATQWKNPHVEEHSTSFLPYVDTGFKIYAIGAGRHFNYKLINGMQREAKGTERLKYYRAQNSAFLDQPLVPDIKQWMINRYFIIEKDWAIVERINWEFLIENLQLIAPITLQFGFLKIDRDLEPQFIVNNRTSYLEELSSGLKSVLSIIFSIVDWIEGVNEGDKGLISQATGTVLIDEIDAHLHPSWQETIIRDLRRFFPHLQFIFTTHSPHVIASAKENEVIKIPEHSGNLKIHPINRNFSSWEIENILDDLMDVAPKDSEDLEVIIEKLDDAYNEKDLPSYDANLNVLKTLIHPNDSLFKVYEIKRSRLLLKQ
jgi:predicted ATP-dependent endonuclease of OLD family